MSHPRIVCLGEVMVEVSLGDRLPGAARVGFAGDTLNTAIYLKRTAPGFDVGYATKLGRDRLSDEIVEFMKSEGLSTGLLTYSEKSVPGLYAISTDDTGERSFIYWRNASAAREMFVAPSVSLANLEASDLIYFSAITLAILPIADRQAFLEWLPLYRAKGGRVAFDSNYRPALWPNAETARKAISDAWRNTDIACPSLDDEIALFGDADADAVIARLRGFGVTSGALKRGGLGPLALDETQAGPFEPAERVVDSTAAGDSFNGAYLAARLTGLSESDCLSWGHQLARQVVCTKGAIMPRHEENR